VQLSDQHKFVLFMILKDQNERLDIADLDNQELFFGQTVEALLPTLTEYDLIEFDKSENVYCFWLVLGAAIEARKSNSIRTHKLK